MIPDFDVPRSTRVVETHAIARPITSWCVRPGLVALVVWLAGCADTDHTAARVSTSPAGSGAPSALTAAAAPPTLSATSRAGMVVTGSPAATAAGAAILEAGGNAIDAAVAAAFALAVTEPTQSGLGGRTQALVVRAGGDVFGVDGTTAVPSAYDPDAAGTAADGYDVVGVPGTVAALATLMDRGGSMPWAEVLAPAARLAGEGFPLTEGEADRLSSIADRLAASPGAARLVRPDGTPYVTGDTLVQPELAEVLRTLGAEGPAAFYQGSIAARMADDLAAQGTVTRADIASYAPHESTIVRGRLASLDLVGTYLPASGGTTIEALQIVERVGLAGRSDDERAIVVGLALLAAFEDRESALADARPTDEDAAWITSPERAAERAVEIQRALRLETAADARTGGLIRGAPTSAMFSEPPNTTHLSVVDARGNAVAMTQSLGPTGGARVATPGLGFLYAATLGGYLGRVEPGDRPWSSQSPLIGLRDDRPVLVIGGAGARRIISGLVVTLLRVELDGADLAEAMASARLHPSATAPWRFEQTRPDRAPPGLELASAFGIEARPRETGVWFARLNAVSADPATGLFHGVADPRWPWGAAAGPR